MSFLNELDKSVTEVLGQLWCDQNLPSCVLEGHVSQDWNALMAAVEKLEGEQDCHFTRVSTVDGWEVIIDGKTFDWNRWKSCSETEALARCIKAVVDKEK